MSTSLVSINTEIMEQNYHQLFSHLKTAEPPAGLLPKVLKRLEKEAARSAARARRQLALASLLLLSSLVALVPIFRAAYADLSASGFLSYLSLLFSDFSIVVSSWQSFAFSLLETIPVVSLTLLLAVTFIFLFALRFFARDVRSVLHRATI